MLSRRYQIITPGDFEQTDIGIYECETVTDVWENKTDLLITCSENSAGYGYDDQAVVHYAERSGRCLGWIEEHKEYIHKIISEHHMFQMEYGFELDGKSFLDRLHLRKIQMKIYMQKVSACIHIEVKPFFFHGHCHCIEVAVQEQEDGSYKADVIENVRRLLLEIRSALREKNIEGCKWAKNHGIFYAFDEDGNMLAAMRRRTCLPIKGGPVQKRSTLYFIRSEWKTEKYCTNSWLEVPMPSGFVIKELNCEKGVFKITSSSGHEAVSGTFFVMMEALTMIEMLYRTRGVTEEEIDKCYYEFLVEDHQKYLDRICKEELG